ncbi:MAG: peptidoglycan-binding protein [Clostridia bacterium]|nr:peptidoglycan-binding protein [Clostridia bacterium]
MKENPVKLTAAMKARVRRMRVQYRRRAIAAAIVCFLLGGVAGAFAYRWYVNSNPDRNVDALPAVTATPEPQADVLPEDEGEPKGDPEAELNAFPEVEQGTVQGDDIFPESEITPGPTEAPEVELTAEPEAELEAESEATAKPKKTKKPKATAQPEVTEPAEVVEQPAEVVEQPAEVVEQPAEAVEQPAEVVEQPAEAVEQPAEAVEQPADVAEQQPETAEQQPETPVEVMSGEPQVIAIVPYGESFTYTTQVNADGTARVEAGDEPFETVSFTQTMRTNMRPTDFAAKYSTQYKLQGDEAGAGFELVLNDYTGQTPIVPQNVVDIGLRSESGDTIERGYQLMDAEISGNYGVALNTNVPKMLYKRYPYSSDREEMYYLVVTTYNDGQARMILFRLESDEPEPTPEVVYGILQKGLKSNEVADMQARLIELGYLQGTADGAFGGMTEEAIKAAQTEWGMEPNGIADNAFQQKLYEGVVRATPVPGVYEELKLGSTGDSVVQLQLRLRELGYYEGKADGGYGEITEGAVKQAQQAYGLPVNGVADQAFQEKVYEPTPAPTSTPEPEPVNAVG